MINETCPKHKDVVMRKAKHNQGKYCPVCVTMERDHVNKPMNLKTKHHSKPSKKAKRKCR